MRPEIRKLAIPRFQQLTNFFGMDSLFPAVYLPLNALLLLQILYARYKGKERTQVLNSFLYPEVYIPPQVYKLFPYVAVPLSHIPPNSLQRNGTQVQNRSYTFLS